MAADTDETIPIFTINDFPTELIVRFAPDLRPKTVSTLRLVSRRFQDVFSADGYYRSYLCYPDKLNLYQHDLEEIGDQEGKWKLLLEAEKRRLGNWRKGRPAKVDTVIIPNDIVCDRFEWQGKTGEGNDHWMLSECRDQKIVLLNVTKAPILTVVDVSSYTSLSRNFALLSTDQVLIDSGTGSIRVFNILNDGTKLSLEYLFTIEVNEEYDRLLISGHSKVIHTYRSLYVTYTYAFTDAVLKVWDLKRAVQLENIDLRELLSPKYAFDLDETSYLIVRPAGYPYVVATLDKDIYSGPEQCVEVVVNLEERQLAFWSGVINRFRFGECMFEGNYMCIQGYDFPYEFREVRVYDLRMRSTFEDKESGLIFQREADGAVTLCNVNPVELVFYKSDIGQYEFVFIDGLEIFQREINLDREKNNFINVFGPFFIAWRCLGNYYVLSTMDMSGTVMFTWDYILREEGDCDRYNTFVKELDFQSLWKYVFYTRTTEENVLKICNF